MDTSFEFIPESEDRIAYVREVDFEDLPEDVQEQLDGAETLYALYDSQGERLALVKERQMAFILARQNNLEPVTVH